MRGIGKEPVILEAIKQFQLIHTIYECGVVCARSREWLACSPDAISLLNYHSAAPSDLLGHRMLQYT